MALNSHIKRNRRGAIEDTTGGRQMKCTRSLLQRSKDSHQAQSNGVHVFTEWLAVTAREERRIGSIMTEFSATNEVIVVFVLRRDCPFLKDLLGACAEARFIVEKFRPG